MSVRLIGFYIGRRGSPAVPRPVQPACALCGMTDINFVSAAAARWRLVLGRLTCAICAGRFPTWMHRQF